MSKENPQSSCVPQEVSHPVKKALKGSPRFTSTRGNSEHAGLGADLSLDRGIHKAAVLPINKPRTSSQ